MLRIMAAHTNAPLDIEALMDRIRSDLARPVKRRPIGQVPSIGAPYTLGNLLRFGAGGDAEPFLGAGWSHAEDGFRWTDGDLAALAFSFERPPGELMLSFTARPLLAAGVTCQRVSALWDGTPIGDWTISDSKAYHALILSPEFSGNPVHVLEFLIRDAFSPSSKNIGADSRRLGLAFTNLALRSSHELGF